MTEFSFKIGKHSIVFKWNYEFGIISIIMVIIKLISIVNHFYNHWRTTGISYKIYTYINSRLYACGSGVVSDHRPHFQRSKQDYFSLSTLISLFVHACQLPTILKRLFLTKFITSIKKNRLDNEVDKIKNLQKYCYNLTTISNFRYMYLGILFLII